MPFVARVDAVPESGNAKRHFRNGDRRFLLRADPAMCTRGGALDGSLRRLSTQRLLDVYPSLGYEVTILPKVTVPERADFVLHTLMK
jgi:hypothetical protein